MPTNASVLLTALAGLLLAAPAYAAVDVDALPVFSILAVAVIVVVSLVVLAFKPQPSRPANAAPELDSASYVEVAAKNDRLTLGSHLIALLGGNTPIQTLEDLLVQFTASSADGIKHALEELKKEKPVSGFYVTTRAPEKHFECRPVIRRSKGKAATGYVLWFYDMTTQRVAQLRLQAENERLKNELKNYSTIINMAPYPIWQRDNDLKITFHNLSYSEAIEDVVEKLDESDTPELDQRVKAIAKTAKDTGKPVSERRHIVVAGERKLYHVTELPVPEQKMSVGFAIDMSEIEVLKEDLSRHISAQTDLLESSASGMAIYGSDMRLKSFNYAFVSLWKFDEVWLDTQPTYGEILEVLREKRKLPEQANFQLFKQQQMKLFTDLIEPREEFFYLPDGKALRVIAIPHALGGIQFAYEDVTDRLALERSYNTLIAVQRETLDNLHEGVAVFGEDGRLKLSNPGYLLMWHIDAELARSEPHVTEVVEKCKSLFIYDDWTSFKQSHIDDIQIRDLRSKALERADGKVIDWRKVPLPDGATLITYLDITDSTLVERSLRERNEALQEADTLKTEFLANMSYELRSPLTSISGFSEMLKQEYFGSLSEKQKEYVGGIHQSSQHLMQLVNDILDLASVEAGYMRLEVSKFDVAAMMKSVLSLTQERAKEHNLKVAFECSPKIGKMSGDETRLKQIMFNLLSNAIRYSAEGSTISLGAKEEGDTGIVLWVQDEGQGISHEEHEAIFGKFYKGRKQEKTKSKTAQRSGTGLGLSIVKSFIELHGGHVELHSEPGKGARFECHLKRHNPELQPTTKSKKAA